MELLESLAWRYATKKMNGEKIPEDKLNNILRAIKLAPSSYGLSPYRVIVVQDVATKERLRAACYNQSQITDSSEVLVFATWDDITPEDVDRYAVRISHERGVPKESLNDFMGVINSTISNLSQEDKVIWAQKQAYIGLGFGLVAAATERVDATPMEGFNPSEVDEILQLNEMGLKSSVILALGYRDSTNDYLANLKKVRWNDEYLFIKK